MTDRVTALPENTGARFWVGDGAGGGGGGEGRPTCTLEGPPTVWSVLSESLSIPEKEWGPAVLEAVTV